MRKAWSILLLFVLVLSIMPVINGAVVALSKPINILQTEITITQSDITSSPYYKGGTGTASDPWILEFGTLDLGGGVINIANFTSGYIVIRNSDVYNGGWVVLNIGSNGNVSNVHITIEDSKFHDITGTGYIIRIEAPNSVITLKNVTLYGSSSNDWWDAVLCVEYSSNITVYINESTLYGGGHIIRVNNVDASSKIVVSSSYLYGVEDNGNKGINWRGLIRVDNSQPPEIWVVNSVLSAKASAGSPVGFSISGINGIKIHLKDSVVKYEGVSFYHFIRIYEGSTAQLIDVENVTIEPNAVSGEDFIHFGSDSGGAVGTVTVTDVTGSGLRYLVGISTDSSGDKILIKDVELDHISGLMSSGNVLTVSNITIYNATVSEVDKVISLSNTANHILFFGVYYLSIVNFSDGADIRGVSAGEFKHISLVDNDRNNDGWADGNGLYFSNVNNTVLEDLYFEDAGWKNIMFDGVHENITIRNFVNKENVNSNGQNMFIAIGPWGTASVKNLVIENGVVYSEDLLTMYDSTDYIDGLTISGVTVHGSSPAGWESGRCGNVVYLLHASNVYIDGLNVEDATVNGIYLDSVNTAEIQHSNFSHVANYGVYITSNAVSINVHNNTFWFGGKSPQAYSDSSSVTAEYNLYTDHISTDNNGDGIADTPYSWAGTGGVVDPHPIYFPAGLAYVIINDTTLADNTYGVVTGGTGTASDPYIVEISTASIPSSFLYGVLIDNVSVYMVLKGSIGGAMSEAAIYIGDHITGQVKLEDLTITSSGKHGLVIGAVNGHIVFGANVKIDGTINGWAMALFGTSNVVIEGVTIDMHSGGWDAIYIESATGITLKSVTVANPAYKGIYIKDSTSITIDGCTLTGIGEMGIYLDGTLSNILINDTTISGGHRAITTAESGVSINGLTIRYVSTSNNDWDGIWFKGVLNNIELDHVTVRSAMWKGIYFEGTGSHITLTNIDMDGEGIYFNHPAIYFYPSADYGITDVAIKDSVIKNIAGNSWWIGGIHLERMRNILMDNVRIENNHRGIIILRCDNVTISNSYIAYNDVGGIILYGVTNSKITKNTITHNRKGLSIYWREISGTYYYSQYIDILNNTFTKNTLNGLYITGNSSHILVKYNVFEENGYGATDVMGGYALVITAGCQNITITWNDFIWNKNNYVANGHSQAYSDSTVFDSNYWSEADLAGHTDSYPIDGSAHDVDPHPRTLSLTGAPLPTPEPPILPVLLLAVLLTLIIIKKRK